MINKPVSTNIITGFLGVGKTSLIKALLAKKPKDEVWAVLINEFGEVGLDSHLLGAGAPKVVIKEVAGGCLCCAAGLPIQVAINQLLAKAKPDRLIIEPTGLGHTDQILALLQSEYYQQVISLDSTLCLIDARKVSVTAYRENELFIKQLQCSDVILANKSSEYGPEAFEDLEAFLLQIGADKAILLQDSCLQGSDITGSNIPNSELTTPMSVVSSSIPKEAHFSQMRCCKALLDA
jgi:G3E family GTPase